SSSPWPRSSFSLRALFDTAERLVLLLVVKLLERLERRLDDVVRIGGAERLGQDVLDPGRLEDRAHRTAGDDAGAFRCGLEQNLAGAIAAEHGVRDGRAGHRDLHHVLLGDLDALLDGGRNFLGLPRPEADTACSVTNDDEGAEAEVLSALD